MIIWESTAAELKAYVTKLSTSVPGVNGSSMQIVSLAAQQAAGLLSALESAGQNYDQHGVDGPNNNSALAESVRLWWLGGFTPTTVFGLPAFTPVTSAAAAWVELDRIARYCYAIASPSDRATAASAFGVTGTATPAPLSPDVRGTTTSTLAGRVTAALAMSSVPSEALGLVSSANAIWSTILATNPMTWPVSDSTITALQTALANATAWITSQNFA